MATQIDSKKKTLNEIFRDMWFRLPEYQRPYVWDEDNVQQLLEDTFEASQANPNAQYFLGSLVLNQRQVSTPSGDTGTPAISFEEYDVLDGQQRLTTLYMIFMVLRDFAVQKQNALLADACREKIFQKGNIYTGAPDRSRIVFDIRGDVEAFIQPYMHEDGSTTQENFAAIADDRTKNTSVRNMARALDVIRAFFSDHEAALDDYAAFLFNKVLLIYVSSGSLQDAFQMFMVLNNRGVRLSNSDILKAENLKEVEDAKQRRDYATAWEDMESYFADGFDNFLYLIRSILVKRRARYNLLREFEENIYASQVYDWSTKTYVPQTPPLKRGSNTFDCINKYFEVYKNVFDAPHAKVQAGVYATANLLTLMKYLSSDLWIAPVLSFYEKFGENEFYLFLRKLEAKFSADVLIGESPTHRAENIHAILKAIESAGSPADLFATQVFDFDMKGLLGVLDGDIYTKKYAKYVMLKLDWIFHNDDGQFVVPSTVSIEHILPQHPAAGSTWDQDFTPAEREEWTNKLGNLMLLSRRKNTSLGNSDYNDKRNKYFAKNIDSFQSSVRIYQKHPQWKRGDLLANHKEMLAELEKSYRI